MPFFAELERIVGLLIAGFAITAGLYYAGSAAERRASTHAVAAIRAGLERPLWGLAAPPTAFLTELFDLTFGARLFGRDRIDRLLAAWTLSIVAIVCISYITRHYDIFMIPLINITHSMNFGVVGGFYYLICRISLASLIPLFLSIAKTRYIATLIDENGRLKHVVALTVGDFLLSAVIAGLGMIVFTIVYEQRLVIDPIIREIYKFVTISQYAFAASMLKALYINVWVLPVFLPSAWTVLAFGAAIALNNIVVNGAAGRFGKWRGVVENQPIAALATVAGGLAWLGLEILTILW